MNQEINKKIGLYIRVSSEKQLKEGFSFEDQEEKLINEAKREKQDYIVYRDGGISGTKTDDRLGLKQLMKDVELGIISKVYVTKISRLARNSRDLQNIIYDFEKHNVYFKSINDGIDTSTPMGNVMVKLMGIFAEMERDTIMEQTRAGAERRAKEGKIYGSNKIYGYDRVPDGRTTKIIVNESESEIVKRIFNMYLNGYGYKAITNRLNKEGIRTTNNKLFSINTIKTILDNPLYAGKIRYGKYKEWTKKRRKGYNKDFILADGNHEAIISYEDYQLVLERMSKNQRRKPPVGKYILAGVLCCPECGSKMVGSKTKYKTKSGPVERLYYTCSQFHNKGVTACHSNSIRVDLIDPIVIRKISKKLNSEKLVESLYSYISNNSINDDSVEGRLRIIKIEIKKLNNRKTELRTLYTDGLITVDELKEDVEKIQFKIKEYEMLLEEVSDEVETTKSGFIDISKDDVKNFLCNISSTLLTSLESDRLKVKELLRIFINSITVKSKSKLDIDIEIDYERAYQSYLVEEGKV